MENRLFIKNNIERIKKGSYTVFLDPIQRKEIINVLRKNNIFYEEFIPFEDATKTIIYSKAKPVISLLKINSKHSFKHNEILGTLFSHNISPTKYGDIIVSDESYLIVLDSIKNYLILNFNLIGRYKVNLEEVNLSIIKDYHIDYIELTILTNSLRLDTVISSLINTSRKKTEELLSNKLVLVNYSINNKKDYLLKDNDIISIRKYGKYLFKGLINTTKKGKYLIKILKYK